jgi:hypothetical protein
MSRRRQFVKELLLGTVVAPFTVGATSARESWPRVAIFPDVGPTENEPPPWELFSPLRVGDGLGFGWTLAGVAPWRHGRIEVDLQHESGAKARLHVYRRAERPAAVAHTQVLELRVANDGHGHAPTDETLAQAVTGLSRVLAGNEDRCVAGLRQLRVATSS